MKRKLLFLSGASIFGILLLTIGCTQYNAILINAEYSTLQGTPISTLLGNLGKPNKMVYNTDGTSLLEWKNIYSDARTVTGLVPTEILSTMSANSAMRCDVSMDINALGKVEKHALICYSQKENISPQNATTSIASNP